MWTSSSRAAGSPGCRRRGGRAGGGQVLLCEQTAHWGGRAPVDGVTVDGAPAEAWIAAAVAELEAMENVHLRVPHHGRGRL
jgi:sarcosine oxidase subunit alpha